MNTEPRIEADMHVIYVYTYTLYDTYVVAFTLAQAGFVLMPGDKCMRVTPCNMKRVVELLMRLYYPAEFESE